MLHAHTNTPHTESESILYYLHIRMENRRKILIQSRSRGRVFAHLTMRLTVPSSSARMWWIFCLYTVRTHTHTLHTFMTMFILIAWKLITNRYVCASCSFSLPPFIFRDYCASWNKHQKEYIFNSVRDIRTDEAFVFIIQYSYIVY